MKPRLSLLLFPAGLLLASGTATWEMNSYQDYLRGRFSGVSLSRDGRLVLAPPLETVFTSGQPVVWSLANAPDGSLYAGTGHHGRLYRIDKSGQGSVLWTADQPEVFAAAVGPDGAVYAAGSPNGKVYRISAGKAEEYFAPGARYVWALTFGKDGALYVGTGDQGRIFRVSGPGKGEVYYDTGQSHVTCLAFDQQGRLLAGSEPNGLLYRVAAKDRAFVLYDSSLPEIRTIIPSADGTIYAAALGGAAARRAAAAAVAGAGAGAGAITVTSTSVTISDTSAAQAGADLKTAAAVPRPGAAAPPGAPAQLPPDIPGIEKSALYKINPDNTVETLWSSKEENLYDVLSGASGLVFSTDGGGRIYRLTGDRKVTLVLQTEEGEVTRLAASGTAVLAAASNSGRVYRVGAGSAPGGSYESPVHDAGTVARWGRLSWKADASGTEKISFQTRSGNSVRPDRTWSDWSQALNDSEGSSVGSPNARYIQWRSSLEGRAGKSPVLDSVTVAYLPQNSPPVVRSVSVSSQSAAGATKPAAGAGTAGTYSITVTDTGDAGSATSSGTPTQLLSRSAAPQIVISWQAEDADGDRLTYSVFFRGEDEKEWKLLKDNLTENTLPVDAEVFADGRYLFRILASDGAANPPGLAREGELVSSPVLIDNTPPVITLGTPRRAEKRIEIDVDAADAASPLRRAEFSVDAGPWTPLAALDGVIDSSREKFQVRIENPSPGEHVVVVRAYDAGGNAGLAKTVLR